MYIISYVKNGQLFAHNNTPNTKAEALKIGMDICLKQEADFFRIDVGKKDPETGLVSAVEVNGVDVVAPLIDMYCMEEYSCAYCHYSGLVSKYGAWTRCPDCGAL